MPVLYCVELSKSDCVVHIRRKIRFALPSHNFADGAVLCESVTVCTNTMPVVGLVYHAQLGRKTAVELLFTDFHARMIDTYQSFQAPSLHCSGARCTLSSQCRSIV